MATKSIILLSLWMACLFSSATSQLCLLSRLDLYPCRIFNPSRTEEPEPNEYAIYSTRIRSTSGANSLECIIRSRDDMVEPLDSFIRTTDTVGGDPNIYYLFSPGRELANPQNYGNQQLIRYRVECEDDQFAFFDLTFLNLEEPSCMDPGPGNQLRCVDYLRLSRGGGDFGFSEICGNPSTIPPEFMSQLDTGSIEVTLRTSDGGRFPGFSATVVCVDNQDLPDPQTSGTSSDPDPSGLSARVQFEARVRRQVEYVHRMRRSAPKSLEEAVRLACSVDELNVPFNGEVTYTDKVVRIVDRDTMAVIRRLPSPINQFVVMYENGSQMEFTREAPPSAMLRGPGRLTRAGVCVFFIHLTTIPDLRGLPPEAVIPSGREADVTRTLLAAHTRLVLEQDSELLSDEQLNRTTFEEQGLPLNFSAEQSRRFRRASVVGMRTIRQELPAVQCNYTDDDLSLAVLNQGTINPVLLTVIRVVINCTEREQPPRIQRITENVGIDFQFEQPGYRVNENDGAVTVCLDVATEGFLPRDIQMRLFTQDNNATAPSDYTSVDNTVTFPSGAQSGVPTSGSRQCIEIAIVDDRLLDVEEVFQVMADSPDPNASTPPPVSITIEDNDAQVR